MKAVDGLTAAAVLFDLDAKEMSPGTSSKGKTTIPKKEKSSTQHNKRGRGSLLMLSYDLFLEHLDIKAVLQTNGY